MLRNTYSLSYAQVRSERLIVGLLLVFCMVLRLAFASTYPSFQFAGNMFQVLEPAHLAAFGYGKLPWEFHAEYGIRTWLLPGFFAGVLKLCGLLSSGSWLYLAVVKALTAALSLVPVVVTYRLARKQAGVLFAVLAALIPGCWFDAVLFAATTLSSAIASYLIIWAAYLAMTYHRKPCERWLPIIIGSLLAVVAIVRFPLLPSVGLVMVFACRRSGVAWLRMGLTFVLLFGAFGMIDAWTWAYPFQSIIKNWQFNIVEHKAAKIFGVSPFYYYFEVLVHRVSYVLVPAFFLLLFKAKRYPLLLAMLVVTLISFSLIGHKEYRFIVLAVTLWPMLMALAMVEVAVQSRLKCNLMGGVWLLVMLGSALLAHKYYPQEMHHDIYRTVRQAGELVRGQYPGRVDQFVLDQSITKREQGGWSYGEADNYTYFHVDIPIIQRDLRRLVVSEPRDDHKLSMLLVRGHLPVLGDEPAFCRSGLCVYVTDRRLRFAKPVQG